MPQNNNFLFPQIPYRLLKNDPAFCEWISNTGAAFREPFFDETITRLRGDALNQQRFKSLSHIDMLAEWAGDLPRRQPSAFIFHVSRCGSTLYSQLLGLQPQYLSLAEVPFFDALLRLPYHNSSYNAEQAANLFDAALQFYISSVHTKPSHVFIKTDSWHLHFYEALRKQYPAVPFILLYRHPLQVLQSQQRRRGVQAVPGLVEAAVFGFNEQQAAEHDLDRYMAHVLHSYFTRMLEITGKDSNCILINYAEGAPAGMQKILGACGETIDEAYRLLIDERSGFHAKFPGQVFTEDNKEMDMPAYLQPAAELYNAIENIRLAKG